MSRNVDVALTLMKMALALLERADSQQWAAICRLQHAIYSVEQ